MEDCSVMPRTYYLCFAALFSCCGLNGFAQQQVAQHSLPDFPDAVFLLGVVTQTDSARDSSSSNQPLIVQSETSPSQSEEQARQTKRILGIIPNFRAVSANQLLPPQSPKEKFVTATEDSFDYSALVIPAALAGYSMAIKDTPEFHQGAIGYGRYLWHSFADQSIENYTVEFVVPTLTHEDIRYYTLGKGGFFKRTGYALSRTVITRSDAGTSTFNYSEVVGAGMAASISNLYYPTPERTFGNTAQKWSINVGIDAATFVFKEFWPDINRKVFHTKD
jgi:hypothetical protein